MKQLQQRNNTTASRTNRLKFDERGLGWLLLLAVFAIVAAASAGGAVAFLLLRGEARPPDQTARFLPADTQVYFSLNLRTGNNQLKRFRDILERFRQRPGFQVRVDDLLDDAKDETGIDLEEDVLPWLGPELAVAVVDVVGSAVAANTGGEPLVVAIFETSNSLQSASVLQDWISYLGEKAGLTFDTTTYRGLAVSSERGDDQHYVVMDDYMLFATDRVLLEDTMDRIKDANTAGSLYASSRFQDARETLTTPRFTTLYVATGAIWRDARRQLGDTVPVEVRRQIDDVIPEWVTVSGSLLDSGAKLVASYVTPKLARETTPTPNSLAAARLLPPDTMGFISFAMEPELDALRDLLGDQKIPDLGPGFYEAFSDEFGLDVDEESSLSDILDTSLDRFEDAFGLDIERDFLSWMTGEFAFALLPTEFKGLTNDPPTDAFQAAAFVQFDADKRDEVVGIMGKVVELLEDNLGLQGDQVFYGDGTGVIFDLTDLIGSPVYQPGYLILGDHLSIATTRETLEMVASIQQGQQDDLATEPEYARLTQEVAGTMNPLIYVNIKEITERATAALDEDGRREYQENVEPFVGPLRALLMAGDTQEELSRFYVILTIE